MTTHVGLIFSGDSFYSPRAELTGPMVAHGVLAVEMEASALYTLAASYGRKALAICTVSDHIVTGEETTAAEREQTFGAMVEIALAAAHDEPLRPPGRQATNSCCWIGTRVSIGWAARGARDADGADGLGPEHAHVAVGLEDGDTVAVVVHHPAGDPLTGDVEPDRQAFVAGTVERVTDGQHHRATKHVRPL